MNNFSEKINFIWSIADLLRGSYKPHEYADVVLPLVVLRRLDAAIEPTRDKVRTAYEQYKDRLTNLDAVLRGAAGSPIYNTSPYNWQRLLDAPADLAQNLVAYLNGFSTDVQDIIEKFDFRRQISRLQASDRLYPVMKQFATIDLHPDRVSNMEMGYIFEELIRRFSEQYNETAGEHFTPREVIRLMVQLLFSQDDEVLHRPNLIRTIYDPACGTGGMLTEAKHFILDHNPQAEVLLFGQELNPTSYAVAKSDMLVKGEDPKLIAFDDTFTKDGHAGQNFNFMLSNPPYGVDWKGFEPSIKREYETQGYKGRFGAGLPRINDGSLLFLQHMISKMKDDQEGSRIAIVFNGSPLFTGDAGSGESEIRRWIFEHDWLEGIVALPDQLFYNTGINTYIWILTNRKAPHRKGKVQLVNAVSFFGKMRKSLGNKRNIISDAQRAEIVAIYSAFEEGEHCRIFDNTDFGYRKITVERPLRLSFHVTDERIARLHDEKAFASLAESKKTHPDAKAQEEEMGRHYQSEILTALGRLYNRRYDSRATFETELQAAAQLCGVRLTPPILKAIISALGERDESATPCLDKKGRPEPDPEARDYENVPLKESVHEYFKREVLPHVPDAWINEGVTDHKDGQPGKVGYEINFNRYFYKYQPPRPLEDIDREIKELEREIIAMLTEVTA